MPSYRIIVIVKTGSDASRKKTMDTVKSFLKDAKIKEEDLGSKALAYKIKHELSGHYYDLAVEGDIDVVDFARKLMEQEDVLRHLVLKQKSYGKKSK